MLGSILHALGRLEKGQENLESKVDGLSQRVDRAVEKVGSLDSDIAVLKERTKHMVWVAVSLLLLFAAFLLRTCERGP